MVSETIKQSVDKQSPIEETYQDVKKLIHKMAWDAFKRYGGDIDDYVSAGNEAFMDAYHSYNFIYATSMSTWLWWKIRGAISVQVHHQYSTYRTDANLDELPMREDHFDPFGLSKDAALVVNMIWETPQEVRDIIHHKDFGEIMRSGLSYRLQRLGWTVTRVLKSFDEIREALQ